MVIEGIDENQNYKLEVVVVDSIGQTYGPAIYSFNGMDWTNDNFCATNDTKCAEIQQFTIYCYQDQIKYPISLSNPSIEIVDRVNDFLIRMNSWEIASRRGWVGILTYYFCRWKAKTNSR